jgi:hypothetical protein
MPYHQPFTLEYAMTKIVEDKAGVELNGTDQLLVLAYIIYGSLIEKI